MIIECTYGPVTTEIMGTSYTFTPDEHGRNVAEVWHPKHIQAFLNVTAHYRRVEKDPGTPDPDTAPGLTSLVPETAELGSVDFPLHCYGQGFTESSVIMFAGQPEPIVFHSETDISTIVKPSLPWGAVTVEVAVKNGEEWSDTLDFTFIDAAARRDAATEKEAAEKRDAEEEAKADSGTDPDSPDRIEDPAIQDDIAAQERERGDKTISGDLEPDEGDPGDDDDDEQPTRDAETLPVTEISGIGPAMEAKLADEGIVNVRQLADLDENAANELDERLGLGGRIARDKWVEQARALSA